MQHLGSTTALLACLVLGSLAGCASTAPGRGVAEIVDDAAITAGVKAALVGDPELKASEINVETYQGVVQLSGFVSSAESVATAATVARTVKGVKSVRNDLRLK
ncbi:MULTISPECIES: BON domain-containing protein [unclassified Massilia]|uniref:BON domain-containing protein n=1 Tax=unclassified Massilia TaxID=2609279 RepID=UPI001E33C4B9|nr:MULTISPECIES: BON domain-containing protein [unclassified Massilia]